MNTTSTNQSSHSEKSKVLRKFIEAQALVGIFSLLFFIHYNALFLSFVILFAFVLQWVQLFFLLKNCRVTQIQKWVSGMIAGVLIKYMLFTVGLVMIFNHNFDLIPSLGVAQEKGLIFVLLLIVYCVPFWFSGIRLSSRGQFNQLQC